MRGSQILFLGALAGVALAATGEPVAGADDAAATVSHAQGGEYLGYEIGEARHYVLGPEEALDEGELASWSITLDRVEGGGGDRRLVFRLQHRREAPHSLRNAPSPGEVVSAQVDAELTVNEHGAPLNVQYVARRNIYGVGDEEFQVTYRYDRGRYKKEVVLQGAQWSLGVDMIVHPGLDPRVPSGLFTFAPQALECMEWRVGQLFERRVGSADTSAPDPVSAAEPPPLPPLAASCNERNVDPAFANPGLLGLAMPELWERRGDAELVLFSPLRPDLVRSGGNRIPITFAPIIPVVPNVPGFSFLDNILPGLSFDRLFGGSGVAGDKDRARDPARHFSPQRMTLSDRVRIEVGPRHMEGLPLTIGNLAGTAYVDDWGTVLRIDLALDEAAAGADSGAGAEGAAAESAAAGSGAATARIPRFIRLLHPNEY